MSEKAPHKGENLRALLAFLTDYPFTLHLMSLQVFNRCPWYPGAKLAGLEVVATPLYMYPLSLSLPSRWVYPRSNLLLPCVRKLYYLHIFKRKQESLHTFNWNWDNPHIMIHFLHFVNTCHFSWLKAIWSLFYLPFIWLQALIILLNYLIHIKDMTNFY
jgi:hypothetical protein